MMDRVIIDFPHLFTLNYFIYPLAERSMVQYASGSNIGKLGSNVKG